MNISIDFYIDLDRVGQAAIGGSLLFHLLLLEDLYFLLFTTFHLQLDRAGQRQFLDKDKDKISKGQVFCRQEGRGQKLDNDIEFKKGQGQLYNQGLQGQNSVAEEQPPEKQCNINLGGGKKERLGAEGRGVEGGGHRGGEGDL